MDRKLYSMNLLRIHAGADLRTAALWIALNLRNKVVRRRAREVKSMSAEVIYPKAKAVP